MRPRHLLTAAAVAAVLAAGATAVPVWEAVAQEVEDDQPVLHEYFNPWTLEIAGASRGAGAAGTGERPPLATGPGARPDLSVQPGQDELIFGAEGPVDRGATATPYGPLDPRAGSSRLDEHTDRVDELNYYANFDPSVMPYKRGVAQNQPIREPGGDYRVGLDRGQLREVRVGGQPPAGHDVFWGSFLLRTESGQLHPIPSVAPDQRLVSVEAEPAVDLTFVRDAADNFYVRTEHEGLVRLNIQIAAPRFYFDGQFDRGVSWRDFASRRPRLTAEVESVAAEVLGSIGVSRAQPPVEALEKLVAHYRDFEGRAFPDRLRGQDLYASVSREQIGVCRHRSLAFLISAQALGVPTRYIYNEAHAFAELFWPGQGWRRIDLGGAAEDVNFTGRPDGRLHDGGVRDTLPQPPNFMREQQRMLDQQSDGAPSSEVSSAADDVYDPTGQGRNPDAGRPQPSAQRAEGAGSADGTASQTDASASADAASGQPPGDAAAAEQAAAAHVHDTQPHDPAQHDPAQHDPAQHDPPTPDTRRHPVRVHVQSAAREFFRGSAFGLQGQLETRDGRPVADRTVQVVLGPPGASPDQYVLLGTARPDAQGHFEGQFQLPADVSIGRWELRVRFNGDAEYERALSD